MTVTAQDTQIGGDHYRTKAVQPWDAMRAWMTPEQFEGFLRGNVIKYVARYPEKGGCEDLRKAAHYLQALIEHVGRTPPEESVYTPTQPEPVSGQADTARWVTWDPDAGLDPPVGPVFVHLRNATDADGYPDDASVYLWQHYGADDPAGAWDIVAFARALPGETTAPPKPLNLCRPQASPAANVIAFDGPKIEPRWVPWVGKGRPPVGRVVVEYRNGQTSKQACRAEKLSWKHTGGPLDIVAYRKEISK